MNKTVIVLTLLTAIIWSCGRKLDKEAYTAFIQEPKNGLIKEKTINGIDMKVWYKPTDLLVQQHIGSERGNNNLIDSLREHYGQYLYFVLSMSKSNQEVLNHLAGNKSNFGAMVNQLAFGMGEKVTLIQNQEDTLQLADFHYARMYGVSSSTDILFAFKNKGMKSKGELVFHLRDFGLLTGNTKYRFHIKDINNIPELRFKD